MGKKKDKKGWAVDDASALADADITFPEFAERRNALLHTIGNIGEILIDVTTSSTVTNRVDYKGAVSLEQLIAQHTAELESDGFTIERWFSYPKPGDEFHTITGTKTQFEIAAGKTMTHKLVMTYRIPKTASDVPSPRKPSRAATMVDRTSTFSQFNKTEEGLKEDVVAAVDPDSDVEIETHEYVPSPVRINVCVQCGRDKICHK